MVALYYFFFKIYIFYKIIGILWIVMAKELDIQIKELALCEKSRSKENET